jgi:UDP-N-acetylmuramate--alanine ligase
MSALARFFIHKKKAVYGYDRTETPLTQSLISEGAQISYDDNTGHIPESIIHDKKGSLIIYTPAIAENNKILNYFKENKFALYKRSEILGFITQNIKTIAVAGTHGKTSISSMTAHILKNNKNGVYAFLGGILNNEQSNLILPKQENSDTFAVVEADEYDRSFLTLHPQIALITSIDADHLDIYKNTNNLVKSFSQFVNNIVQNGILISKKGLNLPVRSDIKQYTYDLEGNADFRAQNIQMNKNGTYKFDFVGQDKIFDNMETAVPGKINLENTIAALAISYLAGTDIEFIRKHLAGFKGVKRRFDYRILGDDFVYIDDYAHHPRELSAFISSVKEIYPDKQITGIFQPHLYSRTQDFADDFAKSLDLLNELYLLDIYPARELPVEGVTSKLIYNKIKKAKKTLCKKEEVIELLKKNKPEVLLTMGAGDIHQLVEPIEKYFSKN